MWEFVPAGCQYRNGLTEARVKATKPSLAHLIVMIGSTINNSPTVTYPELVVLLSRVANVINDRPLGVRSLTNDDFVPVTPNQLLIGRTSTSPRSYTAEETQGFTARLSYQEELLNVWWNLWSRCSQIYCPSIPTKTVNGIRTCSLEMSAYSSSTGKFEVPTNSVEWSVSRLTMPD